MKYVDREKKKKRVKKLKKNLMIWWSFYNACKNEKGRVRKVKKKRTEGKFFSSLSSNDF